MPEQKANSSTVCSEADQKRYAMRLMQARARLLWNNGFYGLLLMHVKFSLDVHCQTAYTDAERIAFSPTFMDTLSDEEMDFVLMHEVLHIALEHCFRSEQYQRDIFNIAADIVVNSNILKSGGSITLREYGELMHLTPNGKEGYHYSVEEVYQMLLKNAKKSPAQAGGKEGSGKEEQGQGQGGSGNGQDKTDAKDNNKEKGQGNGKDKKKDQDKEQEKNQGQESGKEKDQGQGQQGSDNREDGGFDDHTHWQAKSKDDSFLQDVWRSYVLDAAEAISKAAGDMPLGVERIISEWKEPQTDWRTVLNDFVHEEISDYSFSPPDRRFPDSPFFLPDFNDKDKSIENILFFVDTSGSISEEMLTVAFSELKGAIDQFDGKLKGFLGFFDAKAYEPVPFEDVESLASIRPKGGGGTSFDVIFAYVKEHMQQEPPACIVILTDGYATFPPEQEAGGIPVLWLINNEERTPPWGRVTRIRLKEIK
ncbi:MAG: hypothetical protein J6K61_00405 [Clostridia bacterium]|nr:hypothetical protein [Clostridia bacterium]